MKSSPSPVLQVKDLRVFFGQGANVVNVVRGVDFEVRQGETLALVGESGSGKSLTALALMGLLPDSARMSGSVCVAGRSVARLSEKEWGQIRGKQIAMIFQNPMSSLNPVLTIGEQLAETLVRHQRIEWSDAYQRAAGLLKRMRLPDQNGLLRCFPHELSGGMRQRVMIAIAIANNPEILIADEPTTALDASVQQEILDLLRDIQAENGMAIVLVTHDLGLVAQRADRVAVMYAGNLVEEQSASDLLASAQHPYTRALIGARPQRRPRTGARPRLVDIPGQVPAPQYMNTTGCSFAPRCAQALEVCEKMTPPSIHIGITGRAQCHLLALADAAE